MCLLFGVAFNAGYGVTAENIGATFIQLVPGITGAVLAVRIRPDQPRVRTAITILEVVWILIALGRIGQGDPTGILGLILPITILVLVNSRASRAYFTPGGYF